ncbi:hypothetical protein DXG01_012873 [Tephrocybe rancida]|nr:hypothetical protein DXG01_012873 [Tephrocybe rancida]
MFLFCVLALYSSNTQLSTTFDSCPVSPNKVSVSSSFASDGDAGRRAMVYQLFMKRAINSKHRLFKYLGRLPGLNLFVGNGDITAGFDWKHENKSQNGPPYAYFTRNAVGRIIVNFETLHRHLRRNTDLSLETVELLMKPEDSQDVPRAIDFIEVVHAIDALPLDGCNPGKIQEVNIIGIVGEMFTSFMHPFIRVNWTIMEQVVSLSKYSHLSFALFHHFRINLMPNQLCGDTHLLVLHVTRTEKADHLNPESWSGVVISNTVDLTSAWLKGRAQALETLRRINMIPDFDDAFDTDQTVDMLKPFGNGKYPGVSTEADRSLEPIPPPLQRLWLGLAMKLLLLHLQGRLRYSTSQQVLRLRHGYLAPPTPSPMHLVKNA